MFLARIGALALLGTSACATAVHGTRERIDVTSEPSGARVLVEPGGALLTTPGEVELDRGSVYLLTFELAGHRPRTVEVAPEYSWLHMGNLLVGGVIGGKIDERSGAAFQLAPNPAHATLRPLGEAPPFAWKVEVAMPADSRARAEAGAAAELGEACDTTSPFGDATAFAVQQRLRGKLVNSGLFEGVAAADGTSGRGGVRAEVLALCSDIDGFVVLRAVGVTSLRLTLERNGVVLLEHTYSAAVSDRDEAYTGSQSTTREQARIRTVLDSLDVALADFVDDLTETGKLWSGATPGR